MKSIRSFAGGRLAFLKLGLALVGFSGILLKATASQILAFQCDRVLTCNMEFNTCHDKSILFDNLHNGINAGIEFIRLTSSVYLFTMGSECVWDLEEGSISVS